MWEAIGSLEANQGAAAGGGKGDEVEKKIETHLVPYRPSAWRRVDCFVTDWSPPAWDSVTAIAARGRIFVCGMMGTKAEHGAQGSFAWLDVPAARWFPAKRTPFSPIPRAKAAMAAFDDKIYMFSGEM